MAAGGNADHGDVQLDTSMVSSVAVRHILVQADNISVNDLINELECVPDTEDLTTAREEVFTAAYARFKQVITDKGIKEKPQLELKRARSSKDKGIRSLCSDIISLFHYANELATVFPKETLAASSMGRYVNISKELSGIDPVQVPECNGASHVMLLAQITELKGLVTALTKRVDELEGQIRPIQSDGTN